MQVAAVHETPTRAGAVTVGLCDHVDPASVVTKMPASPTATQSVTDGHDTALSADTLLAASLGNPPVDQEAPPFVVIYGPPSPTATQRLLDGHETP
jgi:hypothetical protein